MTWTGWHYSPATGWSPVAGHDDITTCARLMWAARPGEKRNLAFCLTTGAAPPGEPNLDGDPGKRRQRA